MTRKNPKHRRPMAEYDKALIYAVTDWIMIIAVFYLVVAVLASQTHITLH